MKKIKSGFCFLLLQCALLIILCSCLSAPEDAVPYDQTAMEAAIEDALFQGEKQCTVKYLSETFSEETLQSDLEQSIRANYLFSCLLSRLSFTTEDQGSYIETIIYLTYTESSDFTGQIRTSSDEDQMRGVLAEIMEQNAKKTPILLQNYALTEDALADLIAEAEINCAEAPYEYGGIHYFRYDPADEQQLVIIWGKTLIDKKTLTKEKAVLQDAFSQWASKISQTNPKDRTSSYRAIYDALCDAVTYNDSIASVSSNAPNQLTVEMRRDRTAYGALITGSTVCSGYARSFLGICESLGLPCYVMTGKFEGVPHAWNAVEIDGETLYIDCTNGDEGGLKEQAFLFTEAEGKTMGYVTDACCQIPWEQ